MVEYQELIYILLNNPDKRNRENAAKELADVDYAYPEVLNALERASKKDYERDKKVRKAAENSLNIVRSKPAPPVEDVTPETTDERNTEQEQELEEFYAKQEISEITKYGLGVKVTEQADIVLTPEGEIETVKEVGGLIAVQNNGQKDRIWGIDLWLENAENLKQVNEDGNEIELPDHIFLGDLDPQETWETTYKGAVDNVKAIKVVQRFYDPETNSPPNFIPGVEKTFKQVIEIENTNDKLISNVKTLINVNPISNLSVETASIGNASLREKTDDEKTDEDNWNQVVEWSIESLNPGEKATLELNLSVTMPDPTPFKAGEVTITYDSETEPSSGFTIKKIDGASNNFQMLFRDEVEDKPGLYDCHFELVNESEFPFSINKIVIYNGPLDEGEILIDVRGENLSEEERTLEPGEHAYELDWKTESIEPPQFGRIIDFSVFYETQYETKVTLHIPAVELEFVAITIEKKYETTEVESYKYAEIGTVVLVKGLGSKPVEYLEIEDKIPADFMPPAKEQIKVFVKGEQVPEDKVQISIEPEDDDPDHEHVLKVTLEHLEELPQGALGNDEEVRLEYPTIALSPKPQEQEYYVIPALAKANVYPELEEPIIAETDEELMGKLLVIHRRLKIATGKSVRATQVEGKKAYLIELIGQNRGTATATEFTVEELIPNGFTVVEKEIVQGPEAEEIERSSETGQIIGWKFSKLEPRERFRVKYIVTGEANYNAKDIQTVIRG